MTVANDLCHVLQELVVLRREAGHVAGWSLAWGGGLLMTFHVPDEIRPAREGGTTLGTGVPLLRMTGDGVDSQALRAGEDLSAS